MERSWTGCIRARPRARTDPLTTYRANRGTPRREDFDAHSRGDPLDRSDPSPLRSMVDAALSWSHLKPYGDHTPPSLGW